MLILRYLAIPDISSCSYSDFNIKISISNLRRFFSRIERTISVEYKFNFVSMESICSFERSFSQRNHVVLVISSLKYIFIAMYQAYSCGIPADHKIFLLEISTSKYEFNFVHIYFLTFSTLLLSFSSIAT